MSNVTVSVDAVREAAIYALDEMSPGALAVVQSAFAGTPGRNCVVNGASYQEFLLSLTVAQLSVETRTALFEALGRTDSVNQTKLFPS